MTNYHRCRVYKYKGYWYRLCGYCDAERIPVFNTWRLAVDAAIRHHYFNK